MLLLILVAAFAEAGAAEWTVKAALKQIDRATEGMRGLTGKVDWTEQIEGQRFEGSGDLWVDLAAGQMRAEITGNNPRTVIVTLTRVHMFTELNKTAKTYANVYHPDLLAQYLLVGFMPRGNMLKQWWKVESVRETDLDGRQALYLVLKPKDKLVAQAIPFIGLWVDQTNWLPAQAMVRQDTGGLTIDVHYSELAPMERFDPDRFRPDWPEGTAIELIDR